MNPVFIALTLILAIAQVTLPRRWAFLPLIIAGCHLSVLEILPQLSAARLLTLIGLIRAFQGKHTNWSSAVKLDRLFLIFSILLVVSSLGHKPDPWSPSPFSYRVGLVLNILGTYLYGRAYLPDMAAFRRYITVLPLIMVPLSISMMYEMRTDRNPYSIIGAGKEESVSREDKVRAQGPFRGPILAGCLGASTLPLAFMLWKKGQRIKGLAGILACLGIVRACNSSGPLAAVAVTILSLFFWRWRSTLKYFFVGLAVLGLGFMIVKGKGPWHLMASIDLVGGSTGWHRAELIDSGFIYHLTEWMFWGTDYTRHWMQFGVSWSPNHVDMTNYYLHLGVIAGLPVTLLLVSFIVVSFRQLTARMAVLHRTGHPDELLLWRVGTSLAAHAISFVSISYFDQMYIFFYLLLGAMPGIVAATMDTDDGADLPELRLEPAVPVTEVPENKPLRFYS